MSTGTPESELHCPECRYNLHGLAREGYCPECGTSIECAINAQLQHSGVRWRVLLGRFAVLCIGAAIVQKIAFMLSWLPRPLIATVWTVNTAVWVVLTATVVTVAGCWLGSKWILPALVYCIILFVAFWTLLSYVISNA